MSTIKITGKVNSAICYAKVVEEEVLDQIKRMCDSPMSEGSKIRIMPDVHSGKGCTIGTTMTITDKVVPNVVGVDIGCGMLTVILEKSILILKSWTKSHIIFRQGRMCGNQMTKYQIFSRGMKQQKYSI